MTVVNLTEHRFISFDETPIFYRRVEAETPSRGILLIVHGLGEHGARYQEFAKHLVGQGIAVVIPDLRGSGQSGGKRGCVRHFSDFHQDFEALHRHVQRQNPSKPIFVMGHSFGGLVVSSYLIRPNLPPVRGMVLSSPAFGIGFPVSVWRHAAAILCSYPFPDLTQNNSIAANFLMHDRGEVQRYLSDPLVHHLISARLYREMRGLMREARTMAHHIFVSSLILQAGDDRVVAAKETQRFFDLLASTDKEIEVYSNLYHEILHETQKETVYSRICQWILSRL